MHREWGHIRAHFLPWGPPVVHSGSAFNNEEFNDMNYVSVNLWWAFCKFINIDQRLSGTVVAGHCVEPWMISLEDLMIIRGCTLCSMRVLKNINLFYFYHFVLNTFIL